MPVDAVFLFDRGELVSGSGVRPLRAASSVFCEMP
jgi:hypothetical protein